MNCRILLRLCKSLLPQLVLQFRPFCKAYEVDDEVDIIRCSDILKCDVVGDKESSRASPTNTNRSRRSLPSALATVCSI